MLSTPSTSHIPDDAPIYPPSEDSYLLLDSLSLSSEITFLSTRFPPTSPIPLVVELGTGSGIVTAFILQHAESHIFKRPLLSIAVDINPEASSAARITIENAIKGDDNNNNNNNKSTTTLLLASITGDLTSSLRYKTVDVLVFNPPYVPTDSLPTDLLSLSCDGGKDGMEVTNRVIDALDDVLSDRGVFYLLLCKRNKPYEVAERIREEAKWNVELVVEKRCGWEVLSIWRIWRVGT